MLKTAWESRVLCWSQASYPLVLKTAWGSCMQCFLTKQHLMYGSYYNDKDDQVTTRMANDPKWWSGECCVMTKVTTPDDTLMIHGTTKIRPWWQVVITCYNHLDEQAMTLKIILWHLMTPAGIFYCQSQKLHVLLVHGVWMLPVEIGVIST
jgi:hypothetical protein